VYLLTLGEFSTDDFENDGNRWERLILRAYFLIATFIFVIHMLNMLIAIMGEVFTENNEISSMQQTRSHLQLVLDNMWMNDAIA